MHSPFRGSLDGPAGQAENHSLDDLVVIEPVWIWLPPHQPRLMEGKQQVMGIDKVQGAERPS
jgi:hypothetical protein